MALKNSTGFSEFVVNSISTSSTKLSQDIHFRLKCDQIFDLITDTISNAFQNRLGSQCKEWLKNQKYHSNNRAIIYDITAITIASDIILTLAKTPNTQKDHLLKHYNDRLNHVLTSKKIIKYVIDTYILHCKTGFSWKIEKQWLSQLLYMNLLFE